MKTKQKQLFILFFLTMFAFGLLALGNVVLAQDNTFGQDITDNTPGRDIIDNTPGQDIDECIDGTCKLPNPLPYKDPNNLYVLLIKGMLMVVGTLSLVMFVVGGFQFIVAFGSPEKIQGAKDTLLYAVIGIASVLFSYVLLRFILTVLQTPT